MEKKEKHMPPPRGHLKKRVMDKLLHIARELDARGGNGTLAKGFILNYSNKCNFHCKHCYTRSGAGEFGETLLTLEDVKKLADQADALGVYEIDIQGGEPLLLQNLFEILKKSTQVVFMFISRQTDGCLMRIWLCVWQRQVWIESACPLMHLRQRHMTIFAECQEPTIVRYGDSNM